MISKKQQCGIKEFDRFEMLFYVSQSQYLTIIVMNFKEVLLSRVHLYPYMS